MIEFNEIVNEKQFCPLKIDLIKSSLKEKGYFLIKKFPINYDSDKVESLYRELCLKFGNLLSQDQDETIIAKVRDESSVNKYNRGHKSNDMLPFHNDRCDIISLLCVSPSATGGDTIIVQSEKIYDYLNSKHKNKLDILEKEFYFDKKDDIYGEHKYYTLPIFIRYKSKIVTRYIRKFIDSAQEFSGIPKLKIEQLEALECLDNALLNSLFHIKFSLDKGDILLINNFTTLHSRDAFIDSKDSNRLLLRTWISNPEIIELPVEYEKFIGDITSLNRGGMRSVELLKK